MHLSLAHHAPNGIEFGQDLGQETQQQARLIVYSRVLNLPALPTGRRYVTLGTDGFGRSDTRAVLRSFFQVDAQSIVDRILAE